MSRTRRDGGQNKQEIIMKKQVHPAEKCESPASQCPVVHMFSQSSEADDFTHKRGDETAFQHGGSVSDIRAERSNIVPDVSEFIR